LQPDLLPRLLGLVLQSDPLKLGSCKFNIIINIINITSESGIEAKPKTLGYSFAKDLILLNFSFFYIFYAEKIDSRHRTGHVTSNILKWPSALVTIYIDTKHCELE
jgi:hypothetical protein